jgi:regulator of RNase E activity RraA
MVSRVEGDERCKSNTNTSCVHTDARSAIWGGLMTVRAQVNGVQGVILSGRCRDLQEQWASGFPVSVLDGVSLGAITK